MNAYQRFMMVVANLVGETTGLIPHKDELELIENAIRMVIRFSGMTSAVALMNVFMDTVYSGQVPGMDPQFPRETMEAAITKAKEIAPKDWDDMAKYFGLSPV